MVAVYEVFVLTTAVNGTAGMIFTYAGNHHAPIQARYDATVTVTVTQTTCPVYGSVPPATGYSFSTSTPVTVSTTASTHTSDSGYDIYSTLMHSTPSGYGSVPATSVTSSVPHSVSTTSSVFSTPVVTTPVTLSTASTHGYTTPSSSSEITTQSSTQSSTHTTSTASVSIPPAVGVARRVEVDAVALAVLAFAFLH